MVGIRSNETREPETAPAPRKGRERLRLVAVGVIGIYLALGVVAYLPLLPWSSNRLFGTGGDSILATWFFAWIPHSIGHGLNPFFSHSILAPDGVNLAQNTTAPFLGLLTAPLSLVLGPVARSNFMEIVAMPVSATAAFLVLRHWRIWWPAAAIAGLIYGFSPFAIGQGLGHVVFVFVPWPPIIMTFGARILLRIGSAMKNALWLGLLLAIQFLSEPEIFVILVLVSLGLLVCIVIVKRATVLSEAKAILPAGLLALGVMSALLAYPVWMELFGPQHYVGTAQPIINPYYNDLLSFIHPGPLQRISLGFRSLAVPLSNASEAGSFIGWPLLAISAFFVWRSRTSRRMQAATAFTLGAALLSLGRDLAVDGHLTRIHLPFGVLVHLPLLGNILPSRFSLGMFLGLSAVVAFGMDDLRRNAAPLQTREKLEIRSLTVAGVTLLALVISQFPQWPYPNQTARNLPEPIRAAIPRGNPTAITYPYASPNFPEPQLWQIQQNFSFTLVGGYAEHPDVHDRSIGVPNPMKPPGLDLFLEGQEGYNPYLPPVPLTQSLVNLTQRTLQLNDIRLIIVDRSAPRSGPVMALFTRALGPPEVSTGRFALWASDRGAL